MKCLILGAGGQLGRALMTAAPEEAVIYAPAKEQFDITHTDAIERCFDEVGPDLVINAAAYTAVDAAESNAEIAARINTDAVGHLASAANRIRARFVHVSTDFVFDGQQNAPYTPNDIAKPLNIYGLTKLGGETATRERCDDALIVRTSWLYAPQGRNFVTTMLRLMAERDEVRVVGDQIGIPTCATNLADALWALALQGASGVFHFSDEGVASWYDFAVAIREEAVACGVLEDAAEIVPIRTADYPTPARRPRFSVLDKSETWTALGRRGEHWILALRDALESLSDNG